MIAAALGVSPAALLTYGTVPDGEIEVLPGRTIDGTRRAGWWGGSPLSRSHPPPLGCPPRTP